MTTLTDQVLDHLETAIPELARAATNQAFWQTLAAGHSAVICEGDSIYEVFPDGTRRFMQLVDELPADQPANERSQPKALASGELGH